MHANQGIVETRDNYLNVKVGARLGSRNVQFIDETRKAANVVSKQITPRLIFFGLLLRQKFVH